MEFWWDLNFQDNWDKNRLDPSKVDNTEKEQRGYWIFRVSIHALQDTVLINQSSIVESTTYCGTQLLQQHLD